MRGVHGTISVALLATTLAVFLRVSMANPRLSLQCKNIARDVILNSCKGPRIKRSTENENLEKMNENLPKLTKPDDLLGFHLSSEELDELHEEVGDRLARNSKDVNKKIFQHVATKCCPNAKLCYDNPSMIPCMGY
ncbi:PREDICTED: uncharacterized protein LOC108579811 [Habropoda laboriosa]|uniref:uncharacterized protein LOC108579811 n=1 Tax=Habropoda laboriosa TaxID=597456 RepID=UPI00083CE861|nr:PREDICTED: uncharacterized protein LOC108579811 [Habropoda laboriosa]